MSTDYRYEMKYEIEAENTHAIGSFIRMHPAGFRVAYPDRWINNVYYDTPDYTTCRENLDGISERKKFRLRWYGEEAHIVNPIFEIKAKNNSLGRKDFIRIEAEFSSSLRDLIKNDPRIPSSVAPVIKNRYLRSYFEDHSRKFRITVDRQISNGRILYHEWSKTPMTRTPKVILELKFDKDQLSNHKEISHLIPYRQTKHSKYLSAVLSTLAYT